MSYFQGNVAKMDNGMIFRVFTCDRAALLADGWTEVFDENEQHLGWAKCNDEKDER